MKTSPSMPSSGAAPTSAGSSMRLMRLKAGLASSRAELGAHAAHQFFAQHIGDQLGDRFAGFEQDIAGEAIGHDHIGLAAEKLLAFHVADEIQPAGFQQGKASLTSSLPLPASSPLESRPTRGLLHAAHLLGIERAHDGELQQVLRLASGLAPISSTTQLPVLDREDSPSGRALDARDDPQAKEGGRHGPAGVAGGDEGVAFAVLDQVHADRHARSSSFCAWL